MACAPAEVGSAPQPSPDSVAPAVAPVVVDPVVPGWSPVRSAEVAAVYDAPPNWVVRRRRRAERPRGGPDEGVPADAVAEFGESDCAGYAVARAGIMFETGTDLAAAARDAARAWGHFGYLDNRKRAPALTVGAPGPLTTLGGQRATVVEVSVRAASPIGPCQVTRGAVRAIAAPGYTGTSGPIAILVVLTDVGRANTVPEEEIRRILGSLRPG